MTICIREEGKELQMASSCRGCEVSKGHKDGLLKGVLLGYRPEAKTPSTPKNDGPGPGRLSPSRLLGSALGIEAFQGTQLLFVASPQGRARGSSSSLPLFSQRQSGARHLRKSAAAGKVTVSRQKIHAE